MMELEVGDEVVIVRQCWDSLPVGYVAEIIRKDIGTGGLYFYGLKGPKNEPRKYWAHSQTDIRKATKLDKALK